MCSSPAAGAGYKKADGLNLQVLYFFFFLYFFFYVATFRNLSADIKIIIRTPAHVWDKFPCLSAGQSRASTPAPVCRRFQWMRSLWWWSWTASLNTLFIITPPFPLISRFCRSCFFFFYDLPPFTPCLHSFEQKNVS